MVEQSVRWEEAEPGFLTQVVIVGVRRWDGTVEHLEKLDVPIYIYHYEEQLGVVAMHITPVLSFGHRSTWFNKFGNRKTHPQALNLG